MKESPLLKNKVRALELPRGYISWSSLDLVERDEDEWVRRYVHGLDREASKEMKFGTEFANALDGAETDDDTIKLVVSTIEKYKSGEHEMTAILRALGIEVKLLGKLDSYDPKEHSIIEYKTGKAKWDQKRAQKHGQILFYKTMVYLNVKKIPKFKLIWVPTEDTWDDDGERHIAITGKMPVEIEVDHSLADILSMMGRIARGAIRMEQLYKQEIKDAFS